MFWFKFRSRNPVETTAAAENIFKSLEREFLNLFNSIFMQFVYTFALESWNMEIESLHDVWHFLCHLCDPNRLTQSPDYWQLIIGCCTNKKHHHKSIALCFPANQAENLVFITILCFIKSFQAHQWTFVLTRSRPRNRRNCNKFWSLKVFWVKNVKHISAETQNWWYFVKHKRILISLFAD